MSSSSKGATDRDDSFTLSETRSSSSSHEQANCGSSSCRSAHQNPNSQHSDAQRNDCGDSSSFLDAVVDIDALPMIIVSCCAAFIEGSVILTLESIMPEQYVKAFATWLSKQVRQGGFHSRAEKGETFDLELTNKEWSECRFVSRVPACDIQKNPLELPVKVHFHPLQASNRGSTARLPRKPFPSSYSNSAALPGPQVSGLV